MVVQAAAGCGRSTTGFAELHRDEYRLPVMVIGAWVPNAAEARGAERARIFECLREKAPLLNFETEVLGGR